MKCLKLQALHVCKIEPSSILADSPEMLKTRSLQRLNSKSLEEAVGTGRLLPTARRDRFGFNSVLNSPPAPPPLTTVAGFCDFWF